MASIVLPAGHGEMGENGAKRNNARNGVAKGVITTKKSVGDMSMVEVGEMLNLLIGLVITLLVIGVVYWVVMKLLGTVGEMPSIVPVAIQIIFVLIVVWVLIGFVQHLGGAGVAPFPVLH